MCIRDRYVRACVCVCERERERERDRDRDRGRDRDRQTDREREREREMRTPVHVTIHSCESRVFVSVLNYGIKQRLVVFSLLTCSCCTYTK